MVIMELSADEMVPEAQAAHSRSEVVVPSVVTNSPATQSDHTVQVWAFSAVLKLPATQATGRQSWRSSVRHPQRPVWGALGRGPGSLRCALRPPKTSESSSASFFLKRCRTCPRKFWRS